MQLFARLCAACESSLRLEYSPDMTVGELEVALRQRLPPGTLPSRVRLLHWGRPLRRGVRLAEAGLPDGGNIEVAGTLRGGGGDGGSTGAESRSSYLEMYAPKKHEKVDPAEERLALWLNCRLSGAPLSPPCCTDRLGSVYNKDAVLEALISKSLPKELSHITAKSLIDLKLTPNPAFEQKSKATANQATFQAQQAAPFVCPVTGVEANGRARFAVLRKCGTVVSEKALKQFGPAVEEHVGYKPAAGDWMPLNPPKEEVEALRDALVVERLAAKAKKDKKRKEKGGLPPVAVPMATGGRGGGVPADAPAALPGAERAAKKWKATDHVPTGATSAVYASLFTSSRKGEMKETYMCRATSARGMNLT
eukprot:jgi/Tetstr1/432392/TSEL_021789.t1